MSDPLIRNAQEKRQFSVLTDYLENKGYHFVARVSDFRDMAPLTYSFHVNVPITMDGNKSINMPIDVVIKGSELYRFPLLIECKSAGDFTNTNKRRKEEATKIQQLKNTYGTDIRFCLFLCGYFDAGYLGYEAADGIDWVWEHRVKDLEKLGI